MSANPKESLREKLYRAAIHCSHSITHTEIRLDIDFKQSGNALSQLADRLIAVAEPLESEVEELRNNLAFIERWAVYKVLSHPSKECLGVIQHYPPIKKITESYIDGVIPTTYDPYAEIEKLKAEVRELEMRSINDKVEVCEMEREVEELRAEVSQLEVYRTAGFILINRLCNIPKHNNFWIDRGRAMYAICQYEKIIGAGQIPPSLTAESEALQQVQMKNFERCGYAHLGIGAYIINHSSRDAVDGA